MRGAISPKVMAMMIRNAVAPLAAMLVSRAAGDLGPIETNSTRPVAALNRKKPGINETTAEKARAANGKCRRSTIGVTRTLTSMQATSAPVAAFVPATEISAQRAACASMPAAIGNASRRHGIEKKVPKEATAHPAAITSMTKGTGGEDSAIARFAPAAVNPEEAAGADQEHDDAGIGEAHDSQRDARTSQVDGTIEDVRTRDQHHTGTKGYQRCCMR
jgi:hypothetical protein